MINFCRNCGANLEPGATRCRRCGAEVTEEPVEEPSSFQEFKNKLSNFCHGKFFWPLLTALFALLAIVCVAAFLASKLGSSPVPQSEPAETVQLSPSPEISASPQPTQEPAPAWAEIYKSFLETEPSVNSAMVQDAADYGFEGIVTAELFSLADVNNDSVPELLLATKPSGLPGWNVTGELGCAVESYIVCGIKDGRVSPLMCVKPDYRFYPLTLSVNDSWLLELSQSDNARRSMLFRSPQGQSSSLSLGYEFGLEQRCNSLGEAFQVPAAYYSINGSNVSSSEFMEQLFPDKADSLSYFPIYFRDFSPGCLDDLESDWANREIHKLSREDLASLWTVAGSGSISKEASDALPYISEAYCISISNDGQASAMELGIDGALGWDYVSSIQVLSVSVDGADAWLHSSGSDSLQEGQVFQYVVGISPLDETLEDYTLCTEIKLSLYDGSEITKTFYTQSGSAAQETALQEESIQQPVQ